MKIKFEGKINHGGRRGPIDYRIRTYFTERPGVEYKDLSDIFLLNAWNIA